MNDRIKEIERQCWQSTQSEPYALFDVKKFALLLIEECAKQAEYSGYNQMFGNGGLRSKLHKHFGIDE